MGLPSVAVAIVSNSGRQLQGHSNHEHSIPFSNFYPALKCQPDDGVRPLSVKILIES
jgi:hypothetical protein